MRLYRYRRIFGVVAIGTMLTAGGLSIDFDNKPQYEEIAYVVKPGDTLWHIASDYVTNEDNIQNKILDIKKANPHIQDGLQVGDKLIIQKRLNDIPVSDKQDN